MNTELWNGIFAKLSAEHFDPLCEALELGERTSESGQGFAISSATGGSVRVFFEHDRGICGFALGPVGELRPMCGVETIAQRFPRVRLLKAGIQRFSFDEETQFIRDHWAPLQQMFGPGLAETRAWYSALCAELTAKYTRRD